MKRFISAILVLILTLCCYPIGIAADDDSISTYASDLITSCSLTVSNPSGTVIKATATVAATDTYDVVGTSVMRIQERKTSTSAWTTVASITGDYGYDVSSHRTVLKYTGVSGRQYRVTCTYYVREGSHSDTSSNTSSTFEIA